MCFPFAILVIEREPFKLADLPAAAEVWIQVVGGLAALGLAIGWLTSLFHRKHSLTTPSWQTRWFQLTLTLTVLAYAAGASLFFSRGALLSGPHDGRNWPAFCLTLGGVFALLGVGVPFIRDLARLRWRRIWALAQLSIKEAFRRRGLLWALLSLLFIFLFAGWFIPHKPEDEVRTYVEVIFGAMTGLLLITAGLLAAFSIPADVQSHTITTIVTKPVERLEIVLGRFLGLTLLMTLILGLPTAASLGYLLREVDPDAAAENLRARVPLYGELEFVKGGRDRPFDRSWRYRTYIKGGRDSTDRAVWLFRELPLELADRAVVVCEFEFDIARSGAAQDEDRGVPCTLTFTTAHWGPGLESDYQQERASGKLDAAALDRLAEKYGIFEEARRISNKRTFAVAVPGGLFRNALAPLPAPAESLPAGPPPPLLRVSVKCEEPSQYLGAARYDLYLLEDDKWFGFNFFKGAAGLWLRLCLVIAVALSCSTYLSGVISWVTTMFLYATGLFQDFLRDLALGTRLGNSPLRKVSGPGESLVKLFNPQGGALATNPVADYFDEGFRWFLRRFLNLIPDVESSYWTAHVAEGFNISGFDLVLNLLLLTAYVLPWFVLAYYLLKSREVAA